MARYGPTGPSALGSTGPSQRHARWTRWVVSSMSADDFRWKDDAENFAEKKQRRFVLRLPGTHFIPLFCLQKQGLFQSKQGTFGFQVQSRCFLFKGREIKKKKHENYFNKK